MPPGNHRKRPARVWAASHSSRSQPALIWAGIYSPEQAWISQQEYLEAALSVGASAGFASAGALTPAIVSCRIWPRELANSPGTFSAAVHSVIPACHTRSSRRSQPSSAMVLSLAKGTGPRCRPIATETIRGRPWVRGGRDDGNPGRLAQGQISAERMGQNRRILPYLGSKNDAVRCSGERRL